MAGAVCRGGPEAGLGAGPGPYEFRRFRPVALPFQTAPTIDVGHQSALLYFDVVQAVPSAGLSCY